MRHVLRTLVKSFALPCVLSSLVFTAKATDPRQYAVEVSAAVQSSPAQITLRWAPDSLATGYSVYRKSFNGASWVLMGNLGNVNTWTDLAVANGSAYEYSVQKTTSGGYNGTGYVYAGINAPMTDARGKVVLIVDNTYASALAAELTRLQQDLVGDGWTVLRHDVARTDSPVSVKSLIQADYNADRANVKSVFLFGHVPVPYSGNTNPDGHTDHQGAWVADTYYADMDGTWTDSSVNNSGAEKPWNRNVPGDGKFDQSNIPSDLELQVGRVDLANMTCYANKTPARSELDLLRAYLNKHHAFRHGQIQVNRRGLVCDNFGDIYGEAFASTGWRNFAPFFGADANVQAPYGTYYTTLKDNPYLWSYGTGGGSWYTCNGVGSSDDFALNDIKSVFTTYLGSYFGDWDNESNFMRASLGSGYVLATAWGGRPHWFFHHMGLGETIGYSTRLTQNNGSGGLYSPAGNSPRGVHVTLLGDPTLRMHPVIPPANVTASASGTAVTVSWSASADANIQGYAVYRAPNANGPFTRMSGASYLTATTFTDAAPIAGGVYMVRSVKLEQSGSGTYYNPSEGIFASVSGSTVTPTPTPKAPAAPSNFTATPSKSGIALAWQDNSSDETGFRVYRKDAVGTVLAVLNSVSANVATFVDATALPGVTYTYNVTAVNSVGESTASATASAMVPLLTSPATSAAFVSEDTTTRGLWKGLYGKEGYSIMGDQFSYPSYVSVTTSGANNWTWNGVTTDPRAPQKANSSSGIAACWYSGAPWELRLAFQDSNVHRVGVYFLDWDGNNVRNETIDLLDMDTGAVLWSRTLKSFSSGVYWVWDLKGRVAIRTTSSAINGVMSGLFFDSPSGVVQDVSPVTLSPTGGTFTDSVSVTLNTATAGASIYYTTNGSDPTTSSTLYSGPVTITATGALKARAFKAGMNASAIASGSYTIVPGQAAAATIRFNGLNTTRGGAWRTSIGAQGYRIIGDTQSLPSYATLTFGGNQDWTWQYTTTEARALERPSGASRLAACSYSGGSFDVTVNLTDGQSHRVQFYCLDWDQAGRQQRVDVIDAATGKVLDTQTLTSFSGGAYLDYNLKGKVVLRFTCLASFNAVLSGIFFDAPQP